MDTHPKALRYASALAAVERQIVDALPEIMGGLIARTKEGDAKAAVYLIDRVLGKTVGAKSAPADDRHPPYTEEDYKTDRAEHESDRDMRRMLA